MSDTEEVPTVDEVAEEIPAEEQIEDPEPPENDQDDTEIKENGEDVNETEQEEVNAENEVCNCAEPEEPEPTEESEQNEEPAEIESEPVEEADPNDEPAEEEPKGDPVDDEEQPDDVPEPDITSEEPPEEISAPENLPNEAEEPVTAEVVNNGTEQGEEHHRYTEMSTEVTVVNPEELKKVLLGVRSDSEGSDKQKWAIIGHVNNNPNDIDIVDNDTSDGASLSDMLSKLQDDQVMYCLLRMNSSVDMSTTIKFIYIHWIGENVPFVKKGRFGIKHGSVLEHFKPFHISVETGNIDELSEESLQSKIEEGSGTKSHVIDWAEANTRQHRGFTQHQVARNDKKVINDMAPKSTDIDVNDDILEAIKEVRQDSCDIKWAVAGFEDGNPKKSLQLAGKGSGGVDEFCEVLKDNEPQYGIIRTNDVVDGITTVKFVYIEWVGEEVKPMTKGKVSTLKRAVNSIFNPFHVAIFLTNRYDLTEDSIKDKVMSSSGSKSHIKE